MEKAADTELSDSLAEPVEGWGVGNRSFLCGTKTDFCTPRKGTNPSIDTLDLQVSTANTHTHTNTQTNTHTHTHTQVLGLQGGQEKLGYGGLG